MIIPQMLIYFNDYTINKVENPGDGVIGSFFNLFLIFIKRPFKKPMVKLFLSRGQRHNRSKIKNIIYERTGKSYGYLR